MGHLMELIRITFYLSGLSIKIQRVERYWMGLVDVEFINVYLVANLYLRYNSLKDIIFSCVGVAYSEV